MATESPKGTREDYGIDRRATSPASERLSLPHPTSRQDPPSHTIYRSITRGDPGEPPQPPGGSVDHLGATGALGHLPPVPLPSPLDTTAPAGTLMPPGAPLWPPQPAACTPWLHPRQAGGTKTAHQPWHTIWHTGHQIGAYDIVDHMAYGQGMSRYFATRAIQVVHIFI